MAQLLISTEPGIFVMADAVLNSGELATDETFIKIASNGKFAAVRCEMQNMGYYHNGDQPPAPVSPVDAADMDPEELIWIPIFASNAAPTAGLFPGQLNFPSLAPFTIGKLLVNPYQHFFDQVNGAQVDSIYAFDTGNANSQVYAWGVTLLFCISQRLSIQFTPVASNSGTLGSPVGGVGGGSGPGVTAGSIKAPDAVVALAPSVQGNFSVAHGLGAAPALVILEMTSDGAIWKQNPESDATDLLLTSSSGGITGNARCWK
jgi:hypothetical protein